MKQFYKINEISKLYNIGPDSLRYYEKLGLLAPKRGKNNYRLYTLDDLWRLNIIRDLRRLGFPMEKIREYMDNRSVENTRKLLTEELDAIHQQIQELNRLQKNVEERLQTLSSAEDQTLLKIRLQTFPDRYCHTLNTPYHTDEEMDLLVKQLLNKNTENLYIISNHNIGSFLPLKEINNGQYENYSGVFIIDNYGEYCLSGGTYLTFTYAGDYRQNVTYIPELLTYAARHGLVPDGPLLELINRQISANILQNFNYEYIRKTDFKFFCMNCNRMCRTHSNKKTVSIRMLLFFQHTNTGRFFISYFFLCYNFQDLHRKCFRTITSS